MPSERPVLREADLPVEVGSRIQSPLPPVSPAPPPLPLQGLAVCPRCKEACTPSSEHCSRCGFSFLETRAVEARPHAPPEALVGQVLNGKYRVVSVLGEGGFGVVYRVELILFESGNVFALKLLHPVLSRDPTFRRRFLREAALALSLVHENTIQIREFGQTEDGHLFFTMDFCRGEPLKAIIARERFLTVNRALAIVRQILSVMKLAHGRGIIHRDLKPENIFIEKDGAGRDFVKVGDFGLAKSFAAAEEPLAGAPGGPRISPPRPPIGEDITRGGIVGTPRYMSPEQARGEELDGRSDLFSIGIMLHEMLYGVVPAERPGGLSGQTPLDVHAVPEGVKRILRKMLEPRREERYQSAGDLLDALSALPAYTPTYIDGSSEPGARRSRWSRKRVLLGAGTVLIIAGLAVGGLILADVKLFGGRTAWPGFWRVSYPPGLQSTQSSTLPPVVSAPEALEKGPTPSMVPRPATRLSPFPSEGVRAYLSFKKGDVLEYQAFREGMVPDREFTYEVTDEPSPGVYTVKVTPGDRKLVWIVSAEENAFHQEFVVPDGETGQLTETEKRTWLRLPRSDAVVDGDFHQSDIRVHAEPVDLMAPPRHPHCEIFAGCLLVEFREEDRIHYHYYQEQRGLVGIEVYELRAPSSSAKSLEPKSAGTVSPESALAAPGGLGAASASAPAVQPVKVRVYSRYLMHRTGWVEKASAVSPPSR